MGLHKHHMKWKFLSSCWQLQVCVDYSNSYSFLNLGGMTWCWEVLTLVNGTYRHSSILRLEQFFFTWYSCMPLVILGWMGGGGRGVAIYQYTVKYCTDNQISNSLDMCILFLIYGTNFKMSVLSVCRGGEGWVRNQAIIKKQDNEQIKRLREKWGREEDSRERKSEESELKRERRKKTGRRNTRMEAIWFGTIS